MFSFCGGKNRKGALRIVCEVSKSLNFPSSLKRKLHSLI